MFGLEETKGGKKGSDFIFDLEKELKDPKKCAELKKKIEGKIQKIKTALRTGAIKEEFDQYGLLLHGYASLLKVVMRFTA